MATMSLQELQQEVEVITSRAKIKEYLKEEIEKYLNNLPDEVFVSEGVSREDISQRSVFQQIAFLRRVVYGGCLQRGVSKDFFQEIQAFIEATDLVIRGLFKK